MYLKTQNIMDKRAYEDCNTNLLYMDRLLGKRYDHYFTSPNNISSLFNKKLKINGKDIGVAPSEIVKNLKNKLINIQDKTIDSYLTHGDVHHQNIIIGTQDNINFVDLDYSGFAPIAMELAKPYYVDLIGVLFFFFEDELFSLFDLENFSIESNELSIYVKLKKLPKERLLISESKVKFYKNFIQDSRDYLTLNEYLIICHLTSRNPNHYSKKAQILFLIFINALFVFDPFKPETLFEIFS